MAGEIDFLVSAGNCPTPIQRLETIHHARDQKVECIPAATGPRSPGIPVCGKTTFPDH